MQSKLFHALAVIAATFTTTNAAALTFPAKLVCIVVGFTPGGGSDFMARLLSARLTG